MAAPGEDDRSPLLTKDYYPQSRAKADSFINAQGMRMASFSWPVERPKRLVMLVHGIDTHTRHTWLHHDEEGAPCYRESYVSKLNDAGCYVVGMDAQGHGASESPIPGCRCYFQRFDDLINDAEQYARAQMEHARQLGVPFYVMGASFGGCISTYLAQRLGDELDGLVLVAPMLSVERIKAQPVNSILLPLVDCFSACWPTLPAGGKAPNTKYPIIDEYLKRDPLTYKGRVRARVASECLKACDDVLEGAGRITMPLLILHSVNDTMTDPEGSDRLFDAASSAKKEIDRLEGLDLWHTLTHEPDYLEVIARAIAWMARTS